MATEQVKKIKKEKKFLKSASLDDLVADSHSLKPRPPVILLQTSKLKGIKKKFHALKLSRSNTDLMIETNGADINGKSFELFGSENNQKQSFEHKQSVSSNSNDLIVDNLLFNDQIICDDLNSYEDVVDGHSAAESTSHEIERLHKKIEKLKDELVQLQATRDENVKEYLSTCDNPIQTEVSSKDIAQKMRVVFERNNQKTNNSIHMLQKKLEKFQSQLKELEERGIQGPRRIIRAVQDSVRSGASSIHDAVTKPLESINQFIKKDKKNDSEAKITDEEEMDKCYLNIRSSDDDNSSLGSNQLLCSQASLPLFNKVLYNPNEDQINELIAANEKLNGTVTEMKEILSFLMQFVNEQKFNNEQLQGQVTNMLGQWHDISELHQNEMAALKQEMENSAERIECLEYRFTERVNEIEELIDSCTTRVTKMEHLQQQHQQLLFSSPNYSDGGLYAQTVLTKFLSLIISLFAVLLVIASTLSKFILPFTSSRFRLILSLLTLAAILFVWKKY
ncbi:transmembrane and coiled-coil domains protein 2 isoform X4 [Hydra vulgaris]|uniref:Transmembrane and coiled-coil domains protein 2 isoform X4 n=1 Tax=Hydra vulgaris TaxID=6087 RepID=A0ABM4BQP8_HYDVU